VSGARRLRGRRGPGCGATSRRAKQGREATAVGVVGKRNPGREGWPAARRAIGKLVSPSFLGGLRWGGVMLDFRGGGRGSGVGPPPVARRTAEVINSVLLKWWSILVLYHFSPPVVYFYSGCRNFHLLFGSAVSSLNT
jgi:hypothetical protein